jgi:hypothetical protein
VFGLGSGWEQATATVVARKLLKERRADGHSPRRRTFEFILDVLPDDGSDQFRATCVNSWHDPVQGDRVPVLFKSRSRKVKFDRERIHPTRAPKRKPRRDPAEDERWERMKDGEYGEQPPPREQ